MVITLVFSTYYGRFAYDTREAYEVALVHAARFLSAGDELPD
jgi:hypothetical protein